jgi:hypothetical protein
LAGPKAKKAPVGGPVPQANRPGQPEVAKIRRLRQAAENLAASGATEPAAKMRAMAERLEAALKQSAKSAKPAKPAAPQSPKAQGAPKTPAKPAPDKPQKAAAPDAMAPVLLEIRKLSQQLGEMNARIRKLEAAAKPGQP